MRRPLFAVCLCLVAIAALRLWWSPPEQEKEAFCPENGQSVTVSGRICSKDNSSFILDSIILLSDAADSRQEIQTLKNQKWICEYEMSEKDNIDTSPKIGSHVTVQGTFYSFRPASNPGEFDTQAYYRTLGIAGRLKESSVLSADSRYSRWRETLYGIRQYFQNRLYTVFPEKEASILSAMLLGEKGELDREVKELYKRNGIIHILSISGVKTLKLDIPLVPETRINWAFVPLHIAIIYILKLCLDEEIIPRCRFPCSRRYLTKCINWQKKQ